MLAWYIPQGEMVAVVPKETGRKWPAKLCEVKNVAEQKTNLNWGHVYLICILIEELSVQQPPGIPRWTQTAGPKSDFCQFYFLLQYTFIARTIAGLHQNEVQNPFSECNSTSLVSSKKPFSLSYWCYNCFEDVYYLLIKIKVLKWTKTATIGFQSPGLCMLSMQSFSLVFWLFRKLSTWIWSGIGKFLLQRTLERKNILDIVGLQLLSQLFNSELVQNQPKKSP